MNIEDEKEVLRRLQRQRRDDPDGTLFEDPGPSDILIEKQVKDKRRKF